MEAKASLDQVSLSTLSICSCLAEHRDTTIHAVLLFAVSSLLFAVWCRLFAVWSVQKVPFPNVAVALTWDMCQTFQTRPREKMPENDERSLHNFASQSPKTGDTCF